MSTSTIGFSPKWSDIIPSFDGTCDFVAWATQFENAATLLKMSDLHSVIPLFLQGDAQAVYQGLDSTTKGDFNKVKSALTTVFSISPLQAYEQFAARQLRQGECLDVYVADLKRLASIVKNGSADDDWIKIAMVNGLPEDIKTQLVAACSLSKTDLASLVEQARSLVKLKSTVVAVARGPTVSLPQQKKKNQGTVTCFKCGGVGHVSKNCPSRVPSQMKEIKCFGCNEPGHVVAACPRRSKNE